MSRGIKILFIIVFFIFSNIAHSTLPICSLSEKKIANLLIKIKTDKNFIFNLSRCQKRSQTLLSILINELDPHYIKYADPLLRSNHFFVLKFLPLDHKIIQYASKDLKMNKAFILDSLRIDIDILRYADLRLLDDKEFAVELININPKSYLYLSDQLLTDVDLILMALEHDPTIFLLIPEEERDNIGIVERALISHPYNFNFLSAKYQNEGWVKDVKMIPSVSQNLFFKKYLKNEYFNFDAGISLSKGYKITNQAKNFLEDRLFFQKYPLKWKKYNSYDGNDRYKMLLASDFKNGWEKDFSQYPKLIEVINNFLSVRIDDSAINSLTPVSIWKISDQEVIFNLYGVRHLFDSKIDEEIINVNSLTAIAILNEGKWKLDIVDAIYDKNIKTNLAYKNGHKKFYIWDLYQDGDDMSIIFKVEDKYSEYFQIFQKTKSNNYRKFYQLGAYYNSSVIDPNID